MDLMRHSICWWTLPMTGCRDGLCLTTRQWNCRGRRARGPRWTRRSPSWSSTGFVYLFKIRIYHYRVECDEDGWVLQVNDEPKYPTFFHQFSPDLIKSLRVKGKIDVSYVGFGDKGKLFILSRSAQLCLKIWSLLLRLVSTSLSCAQTVRCSARTGLPLPLLWWHVRYHG